LARQVARAFEREPADNPAARALIDQASFATAIAAERRQTAPVVAGERVLAAGPRVAAHRASAFASDFHKEPRRTDREPDTPRAGPEPAEAGNPAERRLADTLPEATGNPLADRVHLPGSPPSDTDGVAHIPAGAGHIPAERIPDIHRDWRADTPRDRAWERAWAVGAWAAPASPGQPLAADARAAEEQVAEDGLAEPPPLPRAPSPALEDSQSSARTACQPRFSTRQASQQ
jgi:hypothetical protein